MCHWNSDLVSRTRLLFRDAGNDRRRLNGLNNRRWAGATALFLAVLTTAGCAPVDEREKAMRELESSELEWLGTETQEKLNDLAYSLESLTQNMEEGDAEVAQLLVDAGLLPSPPEAYLDSVKSEEVAAILRDVDPDSATHQWREDSIRLALDTAIAKVPQGYRAWLYNTCGLSGGSNRHGLWTWGWPAYRVDVCVDVNFQAAIQLFEPPDAPRRQFGVWFRKSGSSSDDGLLVIENVGGGALICYTYENRGLGWLSPTYEIRHQHLSGTFNDDGVLSTSVLGMTLAAMVEDNGERLHWDGKRYQHVASLSEDMHALWSKRQREH